MHNKTNTEGTHSAKWLFLNHSPLQARKREPQAPALLLCPKHDHSCRPHGAPHRLAKEIQRTGVLLGLYRVRVQMPKRANLALLSSNRTKIPIFPTPLGGWWLDYERGHLGQAPNDSLFEDCCTFNLCWQTSNRIPKHCSLPLWPPAPLTTIYLESKRGSLYRSQPQVSSPHQEPQLAKTSQNKCGHLSQTHFCCHMSR